MIEANIVKAQVVVDKGRTVLLGTAEYEDMKVNFRIRYDVETLDEQFIDEFREKLAEDFGIPAYRVDMKSDLLLKKMRLGAFEARLRGYA